MATILDRLTNQVRVNLDDEIQSRWTDAQLLVFMKQAIARAQAVGYQDRLEFMRKKYEAIISAGDLTFNIPSDFLAVHGLWRTDTKKPITQCSIEFYEETVSCSEFEYYIIDSEDSQFQIRDVSSSDIPIRLRYYSKVDIDSLTTASQMPWSGRIDYPICEYVMMRALHVDRYNTASDIGLLNDMEDRIKKQFHHLDTVIDDQLGGFR